MLYAYRIGLVCTRDEFISGIPMSLMGPWESHGNGKYYFSSVGMGKSTGMMGSTDETGVGRELK